LDGAGGVMHDVGDGFGHDERRLRLARECHYPSYRFAENSEPLGRHLVRTSAARCRLRSRVLRSSGCPGLGTLSVEDRSPPRPGHAAHVRPRGAAPRPPYATSLSTYVAKWCQSCASGHPHRGCATNSMTPSAVRRVRRGSGKTAHHIARRRFSPLIRPLLRGALV
jgi:hypothetical protein